MEMSGGLPGPAAFLGGVRAGVERAIRYNLVEAARADFAAEGFFELPEPLMFARERLERDGTSARFGALFAEMLTVAVIAREVYRDAPLTLGEVEAYLDHSYSIFNSFRHA